MTDMAWHFTDFAALLPVAGLDVPWKAIGLVTSGVSLAALVVVVVARVAMHAIDAGTRRVEAADPSERAGVLIQLAERFSPRDLAGAPPEALERLLMKQLSERRERLKLVLGFALSVLGIAAVVGIAALVITGSGATVVPHEPSSAPVEKRQEAIGSGNVQIEGSNNTVIGGQGR